MIKRCTEPFWENQVSAFDTSPQIEGYPKASDCATSRKWGLWLWFPTQWNEGKKAIEIQIREYPARMKKDWWNRLTQTNVMSACVLRSRALRRACVYKQVFGSHFVERKTSTYPDQQISLDQLPDSLPWWWPHLCAPVRKNRAHMCHLHKKHMEPTNM